MRRNADKKPINPAIIILVNTQHLSLHISHKPTSAWPYFSPQSALLSTSNHIRLDYRLAYCTWLWSMQGRQTLKLNVSYSAPTPLWHWASASTLFYSCPALRARITQIPSHPPSLQQPLIHTFSLLFSASLQKFSHNPDSVKMFPYVTCLVLKLVHCAFNPITCKERIPFTINF